MQTRYFFYNEAINANSLFPIKWININKVCKYNNFLKYNHGLGGSCLKKLTH